MARIHLFEFEDLSWFPSSLRNYGTDFLQFLSNKTKLFQVAVPIIEKGLAKSGGTTIIDLGSGGGGGLLHVNDALKKTVPTIEILMSDYYPNIPAFERTHYLASNINYISSSVDARNVTNDLKGLRTQFLSLHHFKPDDARKILQNSVETKQCIAIFEAQERSFPSFLAMFLSPISVLLTTPFIRPFRIGRIIFTYLIPVVPLFVWWDGIISSLRTYSIKEMEDLVKSVENNDSFVWEIGRLKSGPGVVLYLLGTVKK
jgi:hypothetical protein